MRTLKRTVTVLTLALLAGCGQQLVEFGNPVIPTVTSTDPADAATNVGVSRTVNATFSEQMDAATLTAATFTLKQGSTAIAGSVQYAGMTATFTPASDLSSNVFTATITTGAKSAGSSTALAADKVWTFTTASSAVTGSGPAVNSTDPGNSSTGVLTNKQITAAFNRAMDPATITASTFILKQGTTTIPGAVTYAGTTARFVPTSLLASNQLYDATITIGAKDPAGLALAADYKWSFTTAAATIVNTNPPAVTSVNPLDHATNVCPNTLVTATFNDAMDPNTIVAANFTLAAAAPVTGAVSYDALTHTATFTPGSALATSTTFTAKVTTGVKDDTGNAMVADKVWSFTTGATPCQAPINLRSLATFVAVAGAGLTNSNSAGVTTLGGDVGLSPTITCKSDGIDCDPAASKPKIIGTLYQNDSAGKAAQAKADLVLAYNDGCATGAGVCPGPGRPPGTIEADLAGLILAPGVYTSGSTMTIAAGGSVVLDAQGNSNAVWIFQIASALTVNVGASVILTNGAKAANVFWIIGTDSTIGGSASFKGTVLARSSNTVGTGSVVEGRLVCTSGAISLLSDTITLPAP